MIAMRTAPVFIDSLGARYTVSETRRRQFRSRDQLDDDDEGSVRLRCGMIVLVCHRHPTRATGNDADGMKLSASTTEVNAAKL